MDNNPFDFGWEVRFVITPISNTETVTEAWDRIRSSVPFVGRLQARKVGLKKVLKLNPDAAELLHIHDAVDIKEIEEDGTQRNR